MFSALFGGTTAGSQATGIANTEEEQKTDTMTTKSTTETGQPEPEEGTKPEEPGGTNHHEGSNQQESPTESTGEAHEEPKEATQEEKTDGATQPTSAERPIVDNGSKSQDDQDHSTPEEVDAEEEKEEVQPTRRSARLHKKNQLVSFASPLESPLKKRKRKTGSSPSPRRKRKLPRAMNASGEDDASSVEAEVVAHFKFVTGYIFVTGYSVSGYIFVTYVTGYKNSVSGHKFGDMYHTQMRHFGHFFYTKKSQ